MSFSFKIRLENVLLSFLPITDAVHAWRHSRRCGPGNRWGCSGAGKRRLWSASCCREPGEGRRFVWAQEGNSGPEKNISRLKLSPLFFFFFVPLRSRRSSSRYRGVRQHGGMLLRTLPSWRTLFQFAAVGNRLDIIYTFGATGSVPVGGLGELTKVHQPNSGMNVYSCVFSSLRTTEVWNETEDRAETEAFLVCSQSVPSLLTATSSKQETAHSAALNDAGLLLPFKLHNSNKSDTRMHFLT